MNKTLITLSLGLIIWGTQANAQSIEPQVVGSVGDHYTSSGAQLSFTAGEVTIETVSASNGIITQGFHQPESSGVGINEISGKIEMNVFPNPTFDFVTVALKKHSQDYSLALIDAQGKVVHQNTLLKNSATQRIDLSRLAAGTYILRVVSSDASEAATFNIQKLK